ncbi:MAG: SulP family inorganic anion transporter [Bacteroidales bacterium]
MFKYLKNDLPASLVVFLVALPLCLGIAQASGAPLFTGVVAGIIGGIIVGGISGSPLGVSGPAAGLTVIIADSITKLGTFEIFLAAVVIAGLMQIVLGIIKAGIIGYYFPSSVIKGMLAGIGISIFLKQLPHAFGYGANYEGMTDFLDKEGGNTISALVNMFGHISPGVVLVSAASICILIFWDSFLAKKAMLFKIIPGSLIAVVVGILFYVNTPDGSYFSISAKHLVKVPVPYSVESFFGQFSFPDMSGFLRYDVWIIGFTIAVVASLETLLSVEAVDKIDPHKRITPTNRELIAQGVGNTLAGFVGGLPITQVIVRSSANVQSGGRTKMATILHGALLLLSVILIPRYLNLIPLGVLAAILLLVGYKLAKPSLFKSMYNLGYEQFVPFIATIIGVVFTDLLKGIGLGLGLGVMFILIKNYKNSHFLHKKESDDGRHKVTMTLSEELSFLNKGAILKELEAVEVGSLLTLDVRNTIRMNYDILEILDDFAFKAKERSIDIKVLSNTYGEVDNPDSFVEMFIDKSIGTKKAN